MATNCVASRNTSVRADRSRQTTPIPSASSAKTPACAVGSPPSSSPRRRPIGATSNDDTSITAAISAKTQPGPALDRITPARAGAVSTATLSVHPETTFAAVSSSGSRASDGVSAVCAGRVVVIAVEAAAASA